MAQVAFKDGAALQDASSGGHIEVVQLLVEKGADVNVQGEYLSLARIHSSSGIRRSLCVSKLMKFARNFMADVDGIHQQCQ
jgi:hypothetical protein